MGDGILHGKDSGEAGEEWNDECGWKHHGQAGGEKIKLKFQHSLDGWRPGGGTVPAWSPLCSL